MSQFTAFCDSASKANQLEQASTIQNNALGAQGTGKAISDAVKELVGRANGGTS